MNPTIIGIIQVKGGAGRSTLATNLAAELAAHGRTALIDTDIPQGTSASWWALRFKDRAPDVGLELADDADSLVKAIDRCYACKYIIIDGPPRIAELTRAIMMVANLNLVPLAPSGPELWATSDLLDTLKEARTKRPDIDARIVWSRYRASTNVAKQMVDNAMRILGIPALDSKIRFSVSYVEALTRGLAVSEWTNKVTAREMENLVSEVVRETQKGDRDERQTRTSKRETRLSRGTSVREK